MQSKNIKVSDTKLKFVLLFWFLSKFCKSGLWFSHSNCKNLKIGRITKTFGDNFSRWSFSLCFSNFSAKISSKGLIKLEFAPASSSAVPLKVRAAAKALAVEIPALLSSSRNSSVITIPLVLSGAVRRLIRSTSRWYSRFSLAFAAMSVVLTVTVDFISICES